MYHAGKDDEALAIAREAEEKMDYCQKEYCQRIPSVEYEIRYIISRLFLKKEDTENARKYAELLKEYDEGEQLDFWQKGQMLLLRGDLLFAEEEYETAKDIYITASSYWREYHEAVKENVKTTVGFQLRDGKITRDTVNRLWHVKTFYYYLYALLRKAKTKCEGRLGESFCDPAGEYKFSEAMEELEAIKRKGDEAWGGMLKRRYQELAGSVSDVLQMMPDRFYLQEEAQRALNVLKITADQSAYFSLNDKVKENFWVTAKEIRDAYYKWNERIPGKEAMKDRWEDRAAAMKELTVCGMTWQVSFAEIEEELYTVFRRIYDNCTDEEEKQKIAERIIEFWRMEYEKTDLERLSLENLQMLRKTELATGRALFPRLEEELAIRLDDKEILHEFFRNIPKYSEMDDWKKQSRSRIIEIKDIFDRLLVQDVNEWKEDFKRWISEEMWLVDHMEFFKKPETLDMQKKRPLYEVYCQYQIEFKESSRERWVENIKKCEA